MFTQLNIEVCTHCNGQCRYCPVSIFPPQPRVMSNEVFRAALVKVVAAQPKLEWVALNHYNEPLLDPGFLIKVGALAHHNLPLRLFTNGVFLSRTITDTLVSLGNVESVIVNIPDMDDRRYREKTGMSRLRTVLSNVDYVAGRLPFAICVNGNMETQREELEWTAEEIKRHWGESTYVFHTTTNTRGGIIESLETKSTPRADRLRGCSLVEHQLNVDVDGRVFLCCQDYQKRYILGNLLDESLQEILDGTQSRQLQRYIYGQEYAPEDFICRYCEMRAK